MLVAGYLGFGALAAAHDIPLAVASTAVLWALPGQIVFVEMHTLAAPLAATVLAVMLSSARFLPMTMTLMPEMRDPRHRPWKYYVAAQLLSLSGWTMAVAQCASAAPRSGSRAGRWPARSPISPRPSGACRSPGSPAAALRT